MSKIITYTQSQVMAYTTVASIMANIAMWLDLIKGAAVIATALTSFIVLIYWILKLIKAWRFRNDKDSE